MMTRSRRGLMIKVFLYTFPVLLAALWTSIRISESACGAAASSCKNCHEVKGEMRVNSKGAYHTQHAFGDFCAFCHSGNTAATAKAEAHKGMVKPLADLKQSCASCHPDDYEKRSKGYGGGTVKSEGDQGGGPSATGPGSSVESGASASPAVQAPVAASPVSLAAQDSSEILPPTPDPTAVRPEDMVDYNLYWVDRGLNLSLGDWLLILMSFVLAMGFPFLHWLLRVQAQPARAEDKEKARKGVPLRKGAMDEGMA